MTVGLQSQSTMDGKAVADLRAQIMAGASHPKDATYDALARLGSTLLYSGNATMRTVTIPGVGLSTKNN